MDVKNLCLGVLSRGDASGYDIKKYFECTFSHFFAAGYGSIYPALAELAQDGLVRCTAVPQAGKPDRKVYRITRQGLAAFRTELEATPPRHKVRSEFLVLLYFAHLLPPQVLAEKIEQRCSDIGQELALIDDLLGREESLPPGIRFGAGLGQTVITAMRDYLLAHGPALLEATKNWPQDEEDITSPAIGGQA